MAIALTAGFAAYEKAHSSFKPNPPAPEFDQVIGSILSGSDLVASGSAAFAALMAGYAIYQMFKPDPATKKDTKEDGRKTREGVEHVSKQVATEWQASEQRDKLTQRLVAGELHERVEAAVDADAMTDEQLTRIYAKVAEKLGIEGAEAATQNIIEATARSSDEVQKLLADGKFVEAGIVQQRRAEAGDAKQAQLWRDTARIKVLTSVKEAIAAYARAVELDPSDFSAWMELSRLQQIAGSLPQAKKSAENGLTTAKCDRDTMVVYGELGNIYFYIGYYDHAKNYYSNALSLANSIYNQSPDDLQILREIGVVNNKLGDIYDSLDENELQKNSYEQAILFCNGLIARDINNVIWKRDLAVTYNKLGDYFFNKISNFDGAQICYESALEIAEELVSRDKNNTQWQHDLSMSYERLGRNAMRRKIYDVARINYEKKFEIIKGLAFVDPDNARWQRDLSLSYNSFGDLDRETANFGLAHQAYSDGFAIAQRLAAGDPLNSQWQHDLYASHERLGLVAEDLGDVAGAIREFEAGEAILLALIARVGDNPGFARNLAQVRADIARLQGQ